MKIKFLFLCLALLFLRTPFLLAKEQRASDLTDGIITVQQYCAFLNAVAESQAIGCRLQAIGPEKATNHSDESLDAMIASKLNDLYDERMQGGSIMRTGLPGNYCYNLTSSDSTSSDSLNSCMTGLSWNDAEQYCNWRNNAASTSTFNLICCNAGAAHVDHSLKSNLLTFQLVNMGASAYQAGGPEVVGAAGADEVGAEVAATLAWIVSIVEGGGRRPEAVRTDDLSSGALSSLTRTGLVESIDLQAGREKSYEGFYNKMEELDAKIAEARAEQTKASHAQDHLNSSKFARIAKVLQDATRICSEGYKAERDQVPQAVELYFRAIEANKQQAKALEEGSEESLVERYQKASDAYFKAAFSHQCAARAGKIGWSLAAERSQKRAAAEEEQAKAFERGDEKEAQLYQKISNTLTKAINWYLPIETTYKVVLSIEKEAEEQRHKQIAGLYDQASEAWENRDERAAMHILLKAAYLEDPTSFKQELERKIENQFLREDQYRKQAEEARASGNQEEVTRWNAAVDAVHESTMTWLYCSIDYASKITTAEDTPALVNLFKEATTHARTVADLLNEYAIALVNRVENAPELEQKAIHEKTRVWELEKQIKEEEEYLKKKEERSAEPFEQSGFERLEEESTSWKATASVLEGKLKEESLLAEELKQNIRRIIQLLKEAKDAEAKNTDEKRAKLWDEVIIKLEQSQTSWEQIAEGATQKEKKEKGRLFLWKNAARDSEKAAIIMREAIIAYEQGHSNEAQDLEKKAWCLFHLSDDFTWSLKSREALGKANHTESLKQNFWRAVLKRYESAAEFTKKTREVGDVVANLKDKEERERKESEQTSWYWAGRSMHASADYLERAHKAEESGRTELAAGYNSAAEVASEAAVQNQLSAEKKQAAKTFYPANSIHGIGKSLYKKAEYIAKAAQSADIEKKSLAGEYQIAAEISEKAANFWKKSADIRAQGEENWNEGNALGFAAKSFQAQADYLAKAIEAKEVGNNKVEEAYKKAAEKSGESALARVEAAKAFAAEIDNEAFSWHWRGKALQSQVDNLINSLKAEEAGNQAVAQDWRDAAHLQQQSTEFYTKAANAHAAGKTSEGRNWNNAGRCARNAAETLEKAIEVDQNTKDDHMAAVNACSNAAQAYKKRAMALAHDDKDGAILSEKIGVAYENIAETYNSIIMEQTEKKTDSIVAWRQIAQAYQDEVEAWKNGDERGAILTLLKIPYSQDPGFFKQELRTKIERQFLSVDLYRGQAEVALALGNQEVATRWNVAADLLNEATMEWLYKAIDYASKARTGKEYSALADLFKEAAIQARAVADLLNEYATAFAKRAENASALEQKVIDEKARAWELAKQIEEEVEHSEKEGRNVSPFGKDDFEKLFSTSEELLREKLPSILIVTEPLSVYRMVHTDEESVFQKLEEASSVGKIPASALESKPDEEEESKSDEVELLRNQKEESSEVATAGSKEAEALVQRKKWWSNLTSSQKKSEVATRWEKAEETEKDILIQEKQAIALPIAERISLWNQVIEKAEVLKMAWDEIAALYEQGKEDPPYWIKSYWMNELAIAENKKAWWGVKLLSYQAERAKTMAYAVREKEKAKKISKKEAMQWDKIIDHAIDAANFWQQALASCQTCYDHAQEPYKEEWTEELQKIRHKEYIWYEALLSYAEQGERAPDDPKIVVIQKQRSVAYKAPSPRDGLSDKEKQRFPDALLIEHKELSDPSGKTQEKVHVRILKRNSEDPYLRIEEVIDPTAGVVLRREMAADHLLVTLGEKESEAEFLQKLNIPRCALQRVTESVPLYQLYFSPDSEDKWEETWEKAFDRAREINARPEPNFFFDVCHVDSKTTLNNQKYQKYKNQWNLFSDRGIKASEAWNTQRDAPKIKVAIFDCGIDDAHQDLRSNIDGWYNVIHKNQKPVVVNNHGTIIAGIIGAIGIKMAGIASEVKLMDFKCRKDQKGEGSPSDFIKALDEAIKKEVDIVNCSFSFDEENGKSESVIEALERAQEAGIIIVTAAGNAKPGTGPINLDRPPYHYPSFYKYYPSSLHVRFDNMVVVAASTKDTDELADFSYRGKNTVNIAAPGEEIFSASETWYSLWDWLRLFPNSEYGSFEGTSFAVPHVVGALALMKANFLKHNTTELSRQHIDKKDVAKKLVKQLLANADEIKDLQDWVEKSRRLNLADALTNKKVLEELNKKAIKGFKKKVLEELKKKKSNTVDTEESKSELDDLMPTEEDRCTENPINPPVVYRNRNDSFSGNEDSKE